ncbi:MAG: hypothetical protein BRC36_14810 [Cyanobacteria bacterium QH_2_48_84]|nr:MAG: hypothetical protein BRC36_14810 [Cyanobacteria bacterium QH_2_48_84]
MTPMGASWSGQTSKVRCPLGNQVEPWSGQDPRSAPRHHGGYRTTLIASLQQELGGTVEPLRPPHALVAGLLQLASSQSPWECSGYSSRVGGGTAGLGRSATVKQRLRALPRN